MIITSLLLTKENHSRQVYIGFCLVKDFSLNHLKANGNKDSEAFGYGASDSRQLCLQALPSVGPIKEEAF